MSRAQSVRQSLRREERGQRCVIYNIRTGELCTKSGSYILQEAETELRRNEARNQGRRAKYRVGIIKERRI